MPITIRFGQPCFGDAEKEAAAEVMKHRDLTNAGRVRAFEEAFEQYVGGGIAVAVSNCTAALYLAFLGRVGPGDEVIVPALTHAATAHAIELHGAKPVFVDVWPTTGVMDTELIEEKITDNTKAICVVHHLGRAAYMRTTMDIARRYGLFVVEDCAQALGTNHIETHVGLIGDVGCFSFYPVKHITTGEGGMFLTKHPAWADQARMAREFGKHPISGEFVSVGGNFRMTEWSGTIGAVQIGRMGEFLERRKKNYEILQRSLTGFQFLDTNGSHYALTVLLPNKANRDRIREKLHTIRIETSIYYPKPVPLLEYYQEKYGYRREDFPVAEDICRRSLCLSVGPHLDGKNMVYVASQFKAVA